ncbi:MAG: hypothetical protein ACOC12_09730 [Bacteroidota bacterium]
MKRCFTLFLLVLFMAFPVIASQRDKLTIKPALVRMQNENLAPGITMNWTPLYYDTVLLGATLPQYLKLSLDLEGTLIPKPEFNPKTQQANFFFSYLVSLRKAEELTLGQEPVGAPDFGSIYIGAKALYETSQDFSEQNLALGAEIRYVTSHRQAIPNFYASLALVSPLRSALRNALNESNNNFSRIDLQMEWTLRFGRIIIHPEARYFYSIQLQEKLADAGLDQGLYGSVSLGYMLSRSGEGIFRYLQYLFVQYNRGQLPVYTDERETIEMGFTFGI